MGGSLSCRFNSITSLDLYNALQSIESEISDIQCFYIRYKNSNANKFQKEIFDQLVRKNIQLNNTGNKQNVPIILTSLMASRAGTDLEKTLQEADIIGEDEKRRVIMLRIVPVGSPANFVVKDICNEFRLDLNFLVHQVQLNISNVIIMKNRLSDYVKNCW